MANPVTWWRRRRQDQRGRILEAVAGNDESYGFGLMRDLGIPAWRVYPTLDKLEEEGLIEKYVEPEPEGRPARTLYRVKRSA